MPRWGQLPFCFASVAAAEAAPRQKLAFRATLPASRESSAHARVFNLEPVALDASVRLRVQSFAGWFYLVSAQSRTLAPFFLGEHLCRDLGAPASAAGGASA